MGRVREEKSREEKKKEIKKIKSQKKEDPGARKVGKSRNTVFSNDLWLRRVEK